MSHNGHDSRDFTVTLGGLEVPCRLPLIGDRMSIVEAAGEVYAEVGAAQGDVIAAKKILEAMAIDDPGRAAAEAAVSQATARVNEAAEAVSSKDVLTLGMAALGLSWRGSKLAVPSLRSLKHDVMAYGDEVYDALFAMRFKGDELGTAAGLCLKKIQDSLPTEEEVTAAADPTKAPGGSSIAITS